MKMQANPVGVIKKDIYIIRNDINKKVYIGQSLNAEQRFKTHCKRNNDNSLIDAAIQKYGKEHFFFEILESQVLNYNQREKFWIKKYNSLRPNGYNILEGGNCPPLYKGESNPSAKLTDKDVILLKKDLEKTNLSLEELSNKYLISKRQVIRINQGLSRNQLNETYPIRKIPNNCFKLTNQDIKSIINKLKYSYDMNGEIARKFNVEVHLIEKINKGEAYTQPNETYPIREWKSCGKKTFTYEQITNIIDLLKNSKMSFREIARKYNVTHNQISAICNGSAKKYRRKTEQYPLRQPS